MNRCQGPFKKNNDDGCLCSNSHGLFIANRQLSFIVAIMLFILFGVFMTGYFLGKKNIAKQLTEKIQQEAFADQVYASVITQAQDSNQELESSTLACSDNKEITFSTQSDQAIEIACVDNLNNTYDATSIDKQLTHYYAQLIGFGTEKAAQLFVKKLATKGIETEVKKRMSKTAKGRTSYWYQVVTLSYSNKDELIDLVNRITKEEKIKDANIRVC